MIKKRNGARRAGEVELLILLLTFRCLHSSVFAWLLLSHCTRLVYVHAVRATRGPGARRNRKTNIRPREAVCFVLFRTRNHPEAPSRLGCLGVIECPHSSLSQKKGLGKHSLVFSFLFFSTFQSLYLCRARRGWHERVCSQKRSCRYCSSNIFHPFFINLTQI